ncbi:centriole, cilia and spindle-associated protein [Petromyzon marinus]|uniref:centriole, cilia and spindle-associated protein n=1 Tax=Petromyzon marinus TaxID=7757 RepID=UPI003F705C24
MPRVRSEYMQQFCPAEGARDAASRCYQSGVQYRRGRRLLEHAHVPLLWDPAHGDSDSGDDGGGGGQSPPRGASWEAPPREDQAEGSDGGGPSSWQVDSEQGQSVLLDKQEEQHGGPAEPATALAGERLHKKGKRKKLAIKQDPAKKETQAAGCCLTGRNETSAQFASGSAQRVVASNRNAKIASPHMSKSQKSCSLFPRATHQRPPFLSYGWANDVLETGRKKTHNILPSASTVQIHESAMKAMHKRKNARLQFKKKKAQLAEKHREHLQATSDVDNPWMSEYQRSYSARTR